MTFVQFLLTRILEGGSNPGVVLVILSENFRVFLSPLNRVEDDMGGACNNTHG
jgi:hypothetical protein